MTSRRLPAARPYQARNHPIAPAGRTKVLGDSDVQASSTPPDRSPGRGRCRIPTPKHMSARRSGRRAIRGAVLLAGLFGGVAARPRAYRLSPRRIDGTGHS